MRYNDSVCVNIKNNTLSSVNSKHQGQCVSSSRGPGSAFMDFNFGYITASCSFRTSVINMYPGAWVIHSKGFADSTARVEVTPQAQ